MIVGSRFGAETQMTVLVHELYCTVSSTTIKNTSLTVRALAAGSILM